MRQSFPFLFGFVFLAACSSGGDRGETGSATSCGVNAAQPGETVVCSVEDYREGDTCFIGGTPVPCGRNADGDLEITIPNTLFGEDLEISFQGGSGERRTIVPSFDIIPPPSEEIDPPTSPGGEPSPGPAPQPDPEPQPQPEPEPQPEPPPEPAPPPVPLQVSCDETRTMHNTRLGLVEVHCRVEGGGELRNEYIYLPGNRTSFDSNLDNPCGKTADGRYIVVSPDGHEVLEDTRPNSVFNRYRGYLEGTLCRESEGNCHGFRSGESSDTEETSGDSQIRFRSYLQQAQLNQLARLIRPAPFCRIDLQGREVHFYTRMLEGPFRMVLAAQGEDGAWVVETKVFEAPRPSITSSSVSVDDSRPKVRVEFQYSNVIERPSIEGCIPSNVTLQANGTGFYLGYCPLGSAKVIKPAVRGIGSFNQEEEVYNVICGGLTYSLTQGALYKEGTDSMVCTASTDDWWKECHHKGDLSLEGRVSRTCTVKKKEGDAFQGKGTFSVPWAKDMVIEAREPTGDPRGGRVCGTSNLKTIVPEAPLPEEVVKEGGQLKLRVRLPRNHNCSVYEFLVHDLDEFEHSYPHYLTKRFSYQPVLKIRDLQYSGAGGVYPGNFCNYNYPEDDCDKCAGGSSCATTSCLAEGSCSNKGSLRPNNLTWLVEEARNCKRLSLSCFRGDEIVASDLSELEIDGSFEDTDRFGLYRAKVKTISERQRSEGRQCVVACEAFDPWLLDAAEMYSYGACQSRWCVVTYD